MTLDGIPGGRMVGTCAFAVNASYHDRPEGVGQRDRIRGLAATQVRAVLLEPLAVHEGPSALYGDRLTGYGGVCTGQGKRSEQQHLSQQGHASSVAGEPDAQFTGDLVRGGTYLSLKAS